MSTTYLNIQIFIFACKWLPANDKATFPCEGERWQWEFWPFGKEESDLLVLAWLNCQASGELFYQGGPRPNKLRVNSVNVKIACTQWSFRPLGVLTSWKWLLKKTHKTTMVWQWHHFKRIIGIMTMVRTGQEPPRVLPAAHGSCPGEGAG